MRRLALIVCLALPPLAVAQVLTPPLRLPQLPPVGLPDLPAALPPASGADAAVGELDPRRLRELHAARVRELLRTHRDVLEADPNGAPIVRGEVLALAPSTAGMQAAAAAGFTVERELDLAPLALHIAVLHVARATAQALQQVRTQDPTGTYDFNHLYLEAHAEAPAATEGSAPAADTPKSDGDAQESVGLIDSGVDERHEVFRGVTVRRYGCGGQAVPAAHGTGVASLLVGRAPTFHGAAPGAALYAADAFCGKPTGGSVAAVAEAFTWLVQQHIAVINVSLVGPPDALLERIVREALARGCLVVAAVGNDGPAAPPLYPAAWPGVVGVTGVDARGQVLAEAERGAQVKFAAPGADIVAARTPAGYLRVRGTSFAAPIVAGLLARLLAAPDPGAAEQAVNALAHSAQPPGAQPGGARSLDPAYGYGVVGAELRRQPPLSSLRPD